MKVKRADNCIVSERKQDGQIKSEIHLQRFKDIRDTFGKMTWKHNEIGDYE